MDKVEMTKEDREYFKNGVKNLCGLEVIQTRNIINDPVLSKRFMADDLAFMNKELSRQAGKVFAGLLRALKKFDYEQAQTVLTGGSNNEDDSDY